MRFEENQLRAVLYMPYHLDMRLMRMLWSMVSKAEDRSSRVSAVTLPVLILRLLSNQGYCIFALLKEQFMWSEIDSTQTATQDKPFM